MTTHQDQWWSCQHHKVGNENKGQSAANVPASPPPKLPPKPICQHICILLETLWVGGRDGENKGEKGDDREGVRKGGRGKQERGEWQRRGMRERSLDVNAHNYCMTVCYIASYSSPGQKEQVEKKSETLYTQRHMYSMYVYMRTLKYLQLSSPYLWSPPTDVANSKRCRSHKTHHQDETNHKEEPKL